VHCILPKQITVFFVCSYVYVFRFVFTAKTSFKRKGVTVSEYYSMCQSYVIF